MKLVYKISLAVLGLLTLSSLLVGSFFAASFRNLRDETFKWFDASARQLAVTIANQTKESVAYFDYEAVEKFIAGQVEGDPNLLYVEVAFDKGLAERREAGSPASGLFRPFVVEIEEGGATAVRVTLHYSTAVLEKKLGALLWRLAAGSLVTLVVLLALLYTLVMRLVSRPLVRLVEYARVTAAGDLTASVELRSTDEFGVLAGTLNSMTGSLRGMVEKVSRSFGDVEKVSSEIADVSHRIADGSAGQSTAVDTVTSSIGEMNSSIKSVVQSVEKLFSLAGETSTSMMEMATSVEQVTGNAEGLAAAVESTTTSVSGMTESIRNVADNIASLASLVTGSSSSISELDAMIGEIERNSKESYELSREAARAVTEEGLEALGRTAGGMGEIRRSVGNASGVVSALEVKSHEIGSILNVINEVNDQTNLLALNAAIIAAQAGEHGRGFAVVADEIRELSARTSSSTEEISKLISSVQEESRKAVTAMEEGTKRVEDGVKVVEELDAALRRAAENSEKASSASRGIAQATSEQNKGIRQITESVRTVSEMAQEIARATSDQSDGASRLVKSAEEMRELARQAKKALEEQARGIKLTSRASEESARLSQRVLDATREEAKGSDLVVQSIVEIQDVTNRNAQAVRQLDQMVNVLTEQSELLRQEIGRFRISGET